MLLARLPVVRPLANRPAVAYGAKEGQRESIWRRGEEPRRAFFACFPHHCLSFSRCHGDSPGHVLPFGKEGREKRVPRRTGAARRVSLEGRGARVGEVSCELRKMAHSVVERPHRRQTVSCSLLHSDALEGSLAGLLVTRAPLARSANQALMSTAERATPVCGRFRDARRSCLATLQSRQYRGSPPG
ncbi:hypothetical protein MTO96_020400 [Rhipicephalus appendiculatus]